MGDSIQKILERQSFSEKDVACLRNNGHFKELPVVKAQEKYLTRQIPKKHRTEVQFYEDNGAYAQTFWKSNEDCGFERKPIQWEFKLNEHSGEFIGSIHSTLGNLFDDHRMITKFMDAFRFCCDLTSGIKRGDKYVLRFEKLFDSGVFIRYGQIVYAKISHDSKEYEREFVELPGGGTYVGSDLAERDVPFYLPVSYFHVSSLFQRRRFHPVKKRTQAHMGVDFPMETGAKVFAAKEGVIQKIGRNRASGNYVFIDHGKGYVSKYLHLSEIDSNLKRFKKVKAGKTIGKVGCTGYCTKPHLHFAIKKHGKYIDPLSVIRSYPANFEDEILKHMK